MGLLSIFICCSFYSPVAAAAETVVENELTIDQAVEMALKNSVALKQADYNVERSYEALEQAERQANLILAPGPQPSSVWAIATNAHVKYVQWRISEKTKDITRDQLVLSVIQNYIKVLQGTQKLQNAQKALDYALLLKEQEELKYQLGLTSSFALSKVKASCQAAQAAYETTNLELDKTWRDFNYILGRKSEERMVLTDRPEFLPLDFSDLNARVQSTIANSPAMWITEQNLKITEMSLSMDSTLPYTIKEIDRSKAELSTNETRDQLEKTLFKLAKTIKQLEENYAVSLESFKNSKENLRIKNMMYELGMATLSDVLAAEVELANSEKNLQDIIYQHEISRLIFEKPWASSLST